ncbi:MAG: hypothetical protein Kow0059_19900 [Candidatus Sumerlaeia bacterium]
MLPGWQLEFILIAFWILVGVLIWMIHRYRQERKQHGKESAEAALEQELEVLEQQAPDSKTQSQGGAPSRPSAAPPANRQGG